MKETEMNHETGIREKSQGCCHRWVVVNLNRLCTAYDNVARISQHCLGSTSLDACHVGARRQLDYMQIVSLWFMGVLKVILWIMILLALWLTLWARQLRKQNRTESEK